MRQSTALASVAGCAALPPCVRKQDPITLKGARGFERERCFYAT
jgi:hypothetical protein